ncbi:MAG: hypothetical protein RJA57_1579, partial [Bacteroidota bacterium]
MRTPIPLMILVACLQLSLLRAQPYDPARIPKKAVALYEQARERAEDGNGVSATGLLLQAVQVAPDYVDAWLALGSLQLQQRNYSKAAGYFEKAVAIDSVYTINFHSSYAHCLAGIGRFQEALDALDEMMVKSPPRNETRRKEVEKRRMNYRFAIDYQRAHPDSGYVFAPVNLGPGVNTRESEYFPSLPVDGSELVFTRKLNGYNEDFFSSHPTPDSGWSPAENMGSAVNTPQSEGAQFISADGEWLVFTGCNRPDGIGACDLYISYRMPGGWTQPENLGRPLNSDQWESQPCLSPDKRELYFASRRPGGYGGSDLYVSRLQPNGHWGRPENLGPGINSPADEQCPFIHADNQTLYFTSAHWPGYGDDDLFLVRKQPDGTWTSPENLGYPINTIDREGTLFIAADGKTAFYASDRSDSRGGLDIYRFVLRPIIRPATTIWVKGQVRDEKTGKGLESVLELTDLSTRLKIGQARTDETGRYFITVPLGKDYAFNVNRKGYLFFSGQFRLSGRSPDSTYEKDILLTPLEAGAKRELKNVFFDVNRFELRMESAAELDVLVQLLSENPTLRIEIGGHTDNIGKTADNLLLSQNRAQSVRDYLIKKNINPERLTAKGYGASQPVADNRTDTGRARNRRTEI